MDFVKCAPYPVSWQVECPVCGIGVDCEMSEDDAGTYRSGDQFGDPFVVCEECQVAIEPAGIIVVAAK